MANAYKLNLQPLARPEAIVAGPNYRITVLTDRLIRMEYQEEGKFVDEATQRVLCRDFPVPSYRLLDHGDSLEIITDKLTLTYDKKPFSPEGLRIQLKGSFHVYGSAWAYGDEIRDLKGTAKTLDNANGAIPLEPGLMSREGITVLDDSNAAFIGSDQWPAAKTWDSTDLYFFGYGHDYLGCLKDFYHLSGPTPLLPRFALGNWWSRYYRYTEQSYLQLMDKFREEKIPFSTAVIDMDWHLTDLPAKYGSGWTGYTWNRELFPDPRRFMDELHKRDMKITLNVHPADGVRGHEEAYLPMAKELGVDYENEDKIPFDASSREFLNAYFKYLHHPNEEMGVDFWWLDWQQGDRGAAKGIDTLWLLNHMHFIDSGREGKQPLTFSRYAGIGSHRYPVGFSGDTICTWESLDFQPYFTANASNAGYTWWSHDIGGHMLGYRNDEMVQRWVQLGVFSPIMRLHSSNNEFLGKEPWNYSAEAGENMTRFLRLRHKMLPYLYSMNYLTHKEGIPLVQPMYYRNDEPEAYMVPNEFWFGSEMIVCPITRPVDRETLLAPFQAWLPEGDYFDFFTGKHYCGGRRMTLMRSRESMPVLVKAGGIVPMTEEFSDSHLRNPGSLEIHVFNGADGAFDLYEDEGGEPVITRFAFTHGKTSVFRAEILGDAQGIIPQNRSYQLIFRGMAAPAAVTVDAGECSWSYNAEKKEICAAITNAKAFTLTLEMTTEEIADQDVTAAIYRLLHRAQIDYMLKSQVFDAVCQEKGIARIVSRLLEIPMSENLRSAVMEQLLSGS